MNSNPKQFTCTTCSKKELCELAMRKYRAAIQVRLNPKNQEAEGIYCQACRAVECCGEHNSIKAELTQQTDLFAVKVMGVYGGI